MQRIAFGIEYDGANYCGWQRQHHSSTVQAAVETAIAKVANHDVASICAGRTDAGVHAFGQVIHFDTSANRPDFAWLRGVNTYLPKDIRVIWCKRVPGDFDARRSALSRRYCYIITNRNVRPGIMHKAISWVFGELCVKSMQEGATYLQGNHDFASFRGSHCQSKTSIRTIHSIKVSRKAETIILDISANAFLHHMVRNIAGSLIAVGQGKYPSSWINEVLQAKDRRAAGVMAAPNGLYLLEVSYPDEFDLPKLSSSPWFFS